MSQSVRITVLVEDTAGSRGLLGEHGLAFWIEAGSKRALFDTGQGMALEHNARHLKVALDSADAIVLSHGHYDHTGGLGQALKAAPQAKVFAHPAAFQTKRERNDNGTARDVGMPQLDEDEARKKAGDLAWTNQPMEIYAGLFVTGEIPRTTEFEDTGGPFFLDEQCREPDSLIDDQAMFFESAAGTVVLLGCAHAGVINTLQYIRQLTDNRPIYAAMGGMHLVNASQERIDRTTEALRQLNIVCLAPGHCTGTVATAKLWAVLPGKCLPCHAGAIIGFEAPQSGRY